ncbi:GroES-like protein [Xylariaceae sp. FL0255]|nr:GroES-like protein [Xylariaceae sp. FL0255]
MPSFTVLKGSESGNPQAATMTRPDELSGDQVFVRITASGLCGTDLHFRNKDMGLGHEGVAVVEKLGPDCKTLKVGDRVGWGYNHGSCGHCQFCLTGQDVFCAERKMYGEADLDQGSFGSHAIWREAFLFKIPDGISDDAAAPLQCAGATVFSALHITQTLPTETVGVMGVGGLGHLAIQFAAKMGCRVVVLSGSDRKRDEAMSLGAHEFIVTKRVDNLKVEKTIDRLIVTTSMLPDWKQLVPIMTRGASIYPLTVSGDDFSIPSLPLIANGLSVQGCLVASRHVHEKMLEFAALHKITPITETYPLTEEGLLEAMTKLNEGKVHYRAVLKPVS